MFGSTSKRKKWINKTEMMLDNYFYETPFTTIKNPRSLDIYSAIFETTISDYGFIIEGHERTLEETTDEKQRYFKGSFYGEKFGGEKKTTNKLNAFSVIFIILSFLALALSTPIFGMCPNDEGMAFVIISGSVTFIATIANNIEFFKGRIFRTKKENGRILAPLIVNELLFIFLLVVVIMMAAGGCFAFRVTIPLAVITTNVSIIVSMFLRRKKTTHSRLKLKFVYEGVIYHDLEVIKALNTSISTNVESQSRSDAKIRKNNYVNKIEMKIMYSLMYKDETVFEESMETINSLNDAIIYMLLSKPVVLQGSNTYEHAKELVYIPSDKSLKKYLEEVNRRFPTKTHAKTDKLYAPEDL